MESMANSRQLLSILLVEDEEASLALLANILGKKYSGIALYTANNGRKGLEIFNDHRISIVITDINMPGISGVQMAKQISALKPESKFIFLSGKTGKLPLNYSIAEGFEIEHYIPKPVDFRLLFAVIEQCMDGISNH